MRKTITVSTLKRDWNRLEKLLNERKIDYNFYEKEGRLFGKITAREHFLYSLFYSCGVQKIIIFMAD